MSFANSTQYELVLHLMKKIVDCEGGNIEKRPLRNGGFSLRLNSDIPYGLWCDACKKRLKCKTKLMARWSVPIIISIDGERADV